MFAKRWAREKSVKNGKSAKLAAEVSRGGRQLFKTAKLPCYWQKSHALAEKFQEQDNKTLSREGTKADEREKRIRKRRLQAKRKGETDTK